MSAQPYYEDDFATIYHGDCREVIEWLSADVLVTDPPYGMKLRSGRGGAFGSSEIAGDADTSERDWVLVTWITGRVLQALEAA